MIAAETARAVLDALDSGLAILDDQARVVDWNGWLATSSRIPPERALGRRFDELFTSEGIGRLTHAIAEALETGASSVLSHALHPTLLPLKTWAGRPLLHNIAVRAAGRNPRRGCVVQIADITLAAQREAVLRQRQNARYDAVVLSAPDPIVTFDAEGRIQMANPASEAEFGYAASDLVGAPIDRFLDDPDAWRVAFEAVVAGRPVTWPIELTVRRRDGSASCIDASASRWLSESRVFVTAILRDVNAKHAAEAELRAMNETLEERVAARTEELKRAHEQLRQSQKMDAVGQLTGGVAHDFNNLLTPILGALDILQRRGMPDERGQRLVDGALQSADRARTLVQRLLAFARRQPLRPGAVDLRVLVDAMAELFNSTLGVRVRLVIEVPDALPPVQADRNQLEMALLNLAVNARDAMADGGTLSISAELARSDRTADLAAGEYVRLRVADTGCGMDAETLRRATEPFFSTKGIGKGTGLGLAMIHGLAGQLGGALELTSTPGVGTVVSIWLPVASGKAGQAESAERRRDNVEGAGAVLLVDDEDLVRASTAQMLMDLGYSVVEARSGLEALERLKEHRIRLVITDHLMPGITGAELAREVRGAGHPAPILILSGYAELEELAPDLPRLAKPFRLSELADALAPLLRGEVA
ncbi:MAG TPA: ATP-binding protein [Caulobacteraceae bacterium]|jgi:PAS domain S-box-containing protein|nr:ATP-binding protein [Caulobacteraceae bacterium]